MPPIPLDRLTRSGNLTEAYLQLIIGALIVALVVCGRFSALITSIMLRKHCASCGRAYWANRALGRYTAILAEINQTHGTEGK